MALITSSTIATAIYAFLVSYVTDPESRSNPDWIEAVGADPSDSFVGWPIIRLGQVTFKDYEKKFGTGESSIVSREGQMIIMVYSDSYSKLHSVIDGILQVFATYESSLNTVGLRRVRFTVGEGDVASDGADTVHSCPITLEFVV